jgi:cobalt ECF transporter T component CbiQ
MVDEGHKRADGADARRDGAAPAWLLAAPAGAADGHAGAAPRGGRSRRLLTGTVLASLARWVEAAFTSDELARRPGLLQRLDPRVKLVTLLGLIFASVLAQRLVVLLLLVALAVALVLASRLGLRRFALRAWIFIPLFTLAIALPAIFSAVTPGDPVAHLGPLTITSQGLVAAARLVSRVTAAVSFAVLLAVTTHWGELLKAMRVLRVPRTFVFVLSVAYRYVFTLVRLVQEMALARTSRTVGVVSAREDRGFVGASAATAFGKSQATSEELYLAMVSRGYTGEVRTLTDWRLTSLDYAWIAGVSLAIALVVWAEVAA